MAFITRIMNANAITNARLDSTLSTHVHPNNTTVQRIMNVNQLYLWAAEVRVSLSIDFFVEIILLSAGNFENGFDQIYIVMKKLHHI